MYVLTGMMIFLSVLRNVGVGKTIRNIAFVNLLYFVLNWVHLFLMVLLHNSLGFLDIGSFHKYSAFLVTGLSLISGIVLVYLDKEEDGVTVLTPLTPLQFHPRGGTKLVSTLIILSILICSIGKVIEMRQSSTITHQTEISNECESSTTMPEGRQVVEQVNLDNPMLKKLSELGVTETVSFQSQGREVIVGKTRGVGILANASTLSRDESANVEFIRSLPIKDAGFIREISLTDGTYAYYYLKIGNDIKLEFNPVELLTKKQEGIFVYVGKGSKLRGDEGEIFGYFECI
jgi:hypothetical protein